MPGKQENREQTAAAHTFQCGGAKRARLDEAMNATVEESEDPDYSDDSRCSLPPTHPEVEETVIS